MPWGIIIDCGSVAVGGLLGGIFARRIPARISEYLSRLFGITSIAVGISLISKTNSLSAVMLALILGAAAGEALNLEGAMNAVPTAIAKMLPRFCPGGAGSDFLQRFANVLVLLCFGSMGLLGALGEGMTGDASLLITKSVMDLFGAIIFASTIGCAVAIIAVPQFVLYLLLFLCAGVVMPYVEPGMVADFMGCGGIIAIVTGLRIAEIKCIRVFSLLPALVLVMPVSALWSLLG